MKTVFASIFFATFSLAAFALSLTAEERQQLNHRCMVWQPERCTPEHRHADKKFTESILKKGSRDYAVSEITKAGWRYFEVDSDPITALYRFNQVLILNDRAGEAWSGAGAVMAAIDDARAPKMLRRGIELSPECAQCYYVLGKFQVEKLKDWGAAEATVDTAVKKDPKHPEALLLLSRIKAHQKKRDEAKEYLRRAQEAGMKADPALVQEIGGLPGA